MTDRLKARYADGVLTPIERLALELGFNVTIEITDQEAVSASQSIGDSSTAAATPESFGPRLPQLVDELHSQHRPELREVLPADLVQHQKHYPYGAPKRPGDRHRQ
ncbi:MAG: hypothetical protein OXG27_15550 [Chloroflexi bacterium]|nr:hypothetical protein [Chloroflexota bacterium]